MALSPEEIRALASSLQQAIKDEKSSEIEEILKKFEGVPVGEDLLRETKLGQIINKLVKNPSSSDGVKTLAQKIIARWKEIVNESKASRKRKAEEEGGSTAGGSSAAVTPKTDAAEGTNKKVKREDTAPLSSKATSPAPSSTAAGESSKNPYPTIVIPYPTKPRTFKGDNVKHTTPEGDEETLGIWSSIREKCVELVYDALAGDSKSAKTLLLSRCQDVELGVYFSFGPDERGTGNDYRAKIRSLCLNLKAPQNPSLRNAVVQGDIPARNLGGMSKEEMASSSLQALNKKLEVENFFNSRGAQPNDAETDQFKCGKCGARKATYYQMQTRSADEPMTTFVTCLNCNNRWKFS